MPRKKNDKPLTIEEKEKLKFLLANGSTYNAVGKELKRDPKTIKKYALEPEIMQDITEKQRDLAVWYEDLARRMLSSITDQDIEKISAYQRTLSAAVSTDKMRLLRDQSTDNTSINFSVINQLKERQRVLKELLARIQEGRANDDG
jgi:hypothetical protein